MALKNAYSKINIQNLFNGLQKTLATHGAKTIIFDYGQDGLIHGISFTIQFRDRFLPIKIPARIEQVGKVLENQGFRYTPEQIYRVAWRNVNDWVDAQMAMLDSEMVQMEEIFLPYIMIGKNKTLYQQYVDTNFQLSSGE